MVEREVSTFMRTANLENPVEKHRLEQLMGELRFLSDQIERRLKDQIEING